MRAVPFRVKVVALFLAAAAVSLTVSLIGFRYELELALVRQQRPFLRRGARRVARKLWRHELQHRAGAPPHERDLGYAVFSPDGAPLASAPARFDALEVPAALLAKVAAAPGTSTTETLPCPHGRNVRALAERFDPPPGAPPDARPVVVVTYRSLDEIQDQASSEMKEVLSKALPFVVLVSVGAALILARLVANPLARMAEDASCASLGGDQYEVRGSGAKDELDGLAGVLNRTFRRLRETYQRQSQFTSDAAHELRTPVSAILGRAEVALRRERTGDEYRAALRDVHDVAARAALQVEALLHLARLDADVGIERCAVDLRARVEREIAAACARHPSQAERLRLTEVRGEVHVDGDEALLDMLVRNLLENALTHGASDGSVDVALRGAGGRVVVEVRDHGPGVAEEDAERVFDRLYRGDAARTRSTGGAGLGLSIVRAVAEAHGGTVEMRAAEPGAVVRVTLPAAAGRPS